jgi:hypothetical protein
MNELNSQRPITDSSRLTTPPTNNNNSSNKSKLCKPVYSCVSRSQVGETNKITNLYLFVYGIFDDAISNSVYMASNDRVLGNNELERI